jgi:hypothetical protein
MMKIQVNTDANIDGREALATQVDAIVAQALQQFQDRITRVEVHLSDQNAGKNGQLDKRCLIEARLEGRQPVAVSSEAGTVDQAVHEGVGKLARLIESQLGRVARNDRSREKPAPE